MGSTFTLFLPLGHVKARAQPLPGEAGATGAAGAASHRVEAIVGGAIDLRTERAPAQLTDALAGRKLLVVDDDVRNLFVLGSVVEQHGMVMVTAQSGREAVRLLEREPDIAAVLMDIMMPELDGYQTI